MQNVAQQRSDIELTAFLGDLDAGVAVVERYITPDTDAIISRGGTAKMIRTHFSIPVVEISLSAYDVLRAIRLARSFSENFIIIGFENITGCAKMLCDLLQIDAEIITIESAADVQRILEEATKKGYQTILGDMITATYAHRLGLNAILITSGLESIQDAFNQAKQICQAYVELKDRCALMSAMLQMCPPSAVYTKKGDLVYAAPSLPDPTLENTFKKYIPVVSEGRSVSFSRQADTTVYDFDGFMIQAAEEQMCMFCATGTHSAKIPEESAVRIYNQQDASIFNDYFGACETAQEFIHIIEQLACTRRTILLCGERGSNCDETAFYMHIHSEFAENSFILINCARISDAEFENLLTERRSLLYKRNSTVYFAHAEAMSLQQQEYAVAYLYGNIQGSRYIFSAESDCKFQNSELHRYLTEDILCGCVRIPPIRELKNDIPSICAAYINVLNISMGKQILGLSPEAQIFARDYIWPGNRIQMKRVLQSAMMRCRYYYLSEADIKEALKAESVQSGLPLQPDIDLTQSLNEINKRIVSLVLEEEGMNQSKAALRLGISRSTIWRMVHS
nr:sigma-54-dependent transcriptional regulator [Dysosmobacter acutus]